MTTKPKAKKFRIRRNPASPDAGSTGETAAARPIPAPDAQSSAGAASASAQQQPTGSEQSPKAAAAAGKPPLSGQVSSARETRLETDIDAIRQEGLTGRQLRMARRVAQKHDLPATSDFDAVRLLRDLAMLGNISQ